MVPSVHPFSSLSSPSNPSPLYFPSSSSLLAGYLERVSAAKRSEAVAFFLFSFLMGGGMEVWMDGWLD